MSAESTEIRELADSVRGTARKFEMAGHPAFEELRKAADRLDRIAAFVERDDTPDTIEEARRRNQRGR